MRFILSNNPAKFYCPRKQYRINVRTDTGYPRYTSEFNFDNADADVELKSVYGIGVYFCIYCDKAIVTYFTPKQFGILQGLTHSGEFEYLYGANEEMVWRLRVQKNQPTKGYSYQFNFRRIES